MFKADFKIASDKIKSDINTIAMEVAKNLTLDTVQLINADQKINQYNHTVNAIGKATTAIAKTATKVVSKAIQYKVKSVKNDEHLMGSAIKSAAKIMKSHLKNAVIHKTMTDAKQLHAAEDNFANTLADEIDRQIAPSSSTSAQLSHSSTSSATFMSTGSNSTNAYM